MAAPEVPIEVDPATGIWSTDGLPMVYVPRHFFVNNHCAIEEVLGPERYANILYQAGYRSAYTWCEHEAARHGLDGLEVFHHYMKRLSQRGWGRFTVLGADSDSGIAQVRVDHSIFVAELARGAGRKVCYMFAGWLPGALEWVGATRGYAKTLSCRELVCAGEGESDHCVFEVRPL